MSISSVSGSDDSTLQKVSSVERDANRRILAANENVQRTEHEADQRINQLRDEYEKQYVTLESKQESTLDSQRNKGYEAIRDMKRAQEAEQRKVNRDGDAYRSKLEEYYRDTLYNTEKRGNQDLHDLQAQQQHRLEYEQKVNQMQTDELNQKYEIRVGQLRKDNEEKTESLVKKNRDDLEEKKIRSEEALTKVGKKYDDRFHKSVKDQTQLIEKLENKATQQILEIRQDTADKLAAYHSRQSDPFYKLVNLHARLRDEGDEFVLTARIPEYEQEHLSVSVKGENIVIAGYRRNEEKLELTPGHTQGTASFQSFTESFPLSWPVDGHKMTREFEGDEVIVRVPKKNQYAFREPERPKPEKAKVEPPQFPKNIPHIHHNKVETDEDKKPIPKDSGSGTLA